MYTNLIAYFTYYFKHHHEYYTEYTAQGMQHTAKPSSVFILRHAPSVVFSVHTSTDGALIAVYIYIYIILYFELLWNQYRSWGMDSLKEAQHQKWRI